MTFKKLLSFILASLSLCASATYAQSSATLPTDFLDSVGAEFRLIEPGVYMSGSDASAEELLAKYPGGQAASIASATRRRVTLTTRFYLAKRLTTVGDFRRFVEATGYKTTAEQKGAARGLDAQGAWANMPGLNWQEPGFPQTSKSPVVCVSYYDALAYVNWLNATAVDEPELGGKPRYILPTEAQWEYAARAGSKTEFFWGDESDKALEYANVADASGEAAGYKWSCAFPFNDGYAATSPVGAFKPNAWDLYDMIGNVWEWCSDRFGAFGPNPVVDPQGAALGEYRVLRGGGWDAAPALARCAYRGANLPDACNTNYGFRVAFIPPIAAKPSQVEPQTPLAQVPLVQTVESETAQPSSEVAPAADGTAQAQQEVEPDPAQDEGNTLKARIQQLGLAVLEGRKIVGEDSVGRALDMIETNDYRMASDALKAGEEIDDVLRKKIKMTALLAALGSTSPKTPNFDLLPSFEQDRVMLLGSLAFLGLELLKDDDKTEPEPATTPK